MLTHIDLFTGIGGFALAAKWNGLQTEVMCESDKRCREFLSKTWPGVPVVGDVRAFDGAKWQGRFLLTGGVPCQPASRAGKQGGRDDNRWLWPHAIRVVAEAKPRWCLFENPPGIYDVGLDGILADLESLGYEVGTIEIPACAVGSPQIRARVWIVAHRGSKRRQQIRGSALKNEGEHAGRAETGDHQPSGDVQSDMAHSREPRHQERVVQPGISGRARRADEGEDLGLGGEVGVAYGLRSGRRPDEQGERPEGREADGRDCKGDLADTGSINWEERRTIGHDEAKRTGSWAVNEGLSPWGSFVWVPCADLKFRRAPGDSFSLVDGLHRSVLAALGNSIVPQVAAEVIRAIVLADREYSLQH